MKGTTPRNMAITPEGISYIVIDKLNPGEHGNLGRVLIHAAKEKLAILVSESQIPQIERILEDEDHSRDKHIRLEPIIGGRNGDMGTPTQIIRRLARAVEYKAGISFRPVRIGDVKDGLGKDIITVIREIPSFAPKTKKEFLKALYMVLGDSDTLKKQANLPQNILYALVIDDRKPRENLKTKKIKPKRKNVSRAGGLGSDNEGFVGSKVYSGS